MMKTIFGVFFLCAIAGVCCAQTAVPDTGAIVFRSAEIEIRKLTENVYVHTSYLNTESFGRVDCNGMIVARMGEAVVFDTPVDNNSSAALIKWIVEQLHCKITTVVATHFHEDCLGGLEEFHKHGAASFGTHNTIRLARAANVYVPVRGFENVLDLEVGGKLVQAKFFGEGHTKDNIVGYFPNDKVLFGGCLIKALQAGKGYLGDANVTDWSQTVQHVSREYPDAMIIIPGHGEIGGRSLIDYTIELFRHQ
jgi:metallo-beta-lactamase class B